MSPSQFRVQKQGGVCSSLIGEIGLADSESWSIKSPPYSP